MFAAVLDLLRPAKDTPKPATPAPIVDRGYRYNPVRSHISPGGYSME